MLDDQGVHQLARCRRYKFNSPVLGAVAFAWGFILVAMISSPKGKDFRNLFNQPPYTAWTVAGSLATVELYVPSLSASFLGESKLR